MKKDFDVVLTNLDGTQAMRDKTIPLTMGFCVHEALLNTPPETTTEQKVKRWAMVQKSRKYGTVNVTIDESAMIKDACAVMFPTLIFGQINDWLEGTEDTSQTEKQKE